MRHRRLLLLGLTLASLAGLGSILVAWLTASTHRIAAVAANPQMIQAGMERDQVESILGVRPGDYTTTPEGKTRLWPAEPKDEHRWQTSADWFADGATVRVYFDAQGRVLFAASSLASSMTRESLWQRVCRWVGF